MTNEAPRDDLDVSIQRRVEGSPGYRDLVAARVLRQRLIGGMTAAPSHDELVLRLRAVVKDELSAGTPREEVVKALVELRENDPEFEDVALDVLDFVEGWANPHLRI